MIRIAALSNISVRFLSLQLVFVICLSQVANAEVCPTDAACVGETKIGEVTTGHGGFEVYGAELDLDLDSGSVVGSALLAELEREPAIELVQAWAVEQARLSPALCRRMLRQARLRGALPLVRLRARFGSDSETDWDQLDNIDSRKLDEKVGLDLWLEWDLAELASGIDMARALRESRARLELRHAILARVTTDYFDRRLLRAEELLNGSAEAADIVTRRLRVQELDATLDALTGGRWSHALRSGPRDSSQQDSDPRLRFPIHPTYRSTDSRAERVLRGPPLQPAPR
tara:strand:- start:996 stop:1856 length:861 start_codon:yes stop_codon:yes gene_type:complete